MPAKKYKPEEIIGKLRDVEIALGQGETVAEACRRIAVSEQTYYRCRQEYGGLKTDRALRMKDLSVHILRSGIARCADVRVDGVEVGLALRCLLPH